jgi:hypothetical protein
MRPHTAASLPLSSRDLVKKLHLPLLAATALVLLAGAARAEPVLVKSAKNGTDSLTKADVKDYFLGKKKTFANGTAVTVVLPAAGSPEMKWLSADIIGASEGTVASKIKEQIFKGEMKKPPVAATADECFAEVKKADGAICVVDAATKPPAGVAVLPVKD